MLFTGCEASVSTGGDTVDADNAADTIKQQYPDKAGGGLTITEISCDEGKAEVDAKFNCTATNSAGSDLEMRLDLVSLPSDETSSVGSYVWPAVRALVPELAGRTILLAPRRDAQDRVQWLCVPVDIPHRYLPKACRG